MPIQEKRQAGDETEVTPEMINAGAAELALWRQGDDRGELIAEAVFLKMLATMAGKDPRQPSCSKVLHDNT